MTYIDISYTQVLTKRKINAIDSYHTSLNRKNEENNHIIDMLQLFNYTEQINIRNFRHYMMIVFTDSE